MADLSINDVLEIENEIWDMIGHLSTVHFKKTGSLKELKEETFQKVMLKFLEIERTDGNLNRINYDGKINKSYIYATVRSCFVDLIRKRKTKTSEIKHELTNVDCSLSKEKLIELCLKKIPHLHWFQREVIRLMIEGHSYRSIEAETGINHMTIFLSVKAAREQIQQDEKIQQAYREWREQCSRFQDRTY